MNLFRLLAAQLAWFVTLVFRLAEAHLKWFAALLLVAGGFAFAQDVIPQVGNVVVPDYIWTIASLVIGWLVKEISSPLTALLKAHFGFQGSATRYVYLLLSALFVVGFGLVSGAFGGGSAGWWAAAGALVTALLKGFGDYAKLQQAAASAVPEVIPAELAATPSLVPAPAVIGDHVVYPKDALGTEPLIHNGQVIGGVLPLTPLGDRTLTEGLK
ncbi:hypothetical protein DKM44_12760 [Deinococcus irradiatisoli]|uniref:Uncharacterized protein n=1 Tax=Deinococcus irradiatisoli TaxID=2202254 RepID=A0A2Z3JG40_9DEIO|nr:hypothetical protein [Deinococcus irradiatisoli]AWN23992.1 hypothetical protein DKM44_12760 [Deinococcus irradiatisoli]